MPAYFDPAQPDFIANPYPTFKKLHQDTPIFWHDGMWFVSSHHDLTTLLRDRRLGRQITHIVDPAAVGIPPRHPANAAFDMLSDNSMFDKEPPEHTRIKILVHKVFTPRRVEQLRDKIAVICNHLIDDMDSEFDLLEEYAVPLPVMVIAELLGIPEADRGKLRPWSAAIVRMYELNPSEDTAQKAVQAASEFTEYLRTLSRQRRVNQQDDLISGLAAVEDGGQTLSEDELIATCILLLNAGHEATVNALGNGMLALLKHSEQYIMLRKNLDLVPGAMEEMLRYDSPLQMFRRWVLEDFAYNGVQFKLGQEIAFLFGAANHDPAVFDRPDAFDITRNPNPHITFSVGIHYCLGAPLARLELQIALHTLLQRLPNLEIVEAPEFHPAFVIRGLKSFRLRGSG
ncbi:MAG: cytochrome P450 [Chloroflexi bacterium]|nr:cytochrome P450 [Chloroflexota bacterium]